MKRTRIFISLLVMIVMILGITPPAGRVAAGDQGLATTGDNRVAPNQADGDQHDLTTEEAATGQELIVEVAVEVRDAADVALLGSLGYDCEIGLCQLELPDGEEEALRQLGLPVTITAKAVKLTLENLSTGDGVLQRGEHFVYLIDETDYPIPDYDPFHDVIGDRLEYININMTPTDAVVTKLKYGLRVVHDYVGDLYVGIYHPGIKVDLWNRSGGPDDGGLDDDTATDKDIEIIYRETTQYNGLPVNGQWWILVSDNAWWNTGYIDYFYFYVYYWICEVSDLPTSPVNPSPADGATEVSSETSLSWSGVPQATSYDVYLGTSSPPDFYANTSSNFYTPELGGQTHYYWKVVAKNACGEASSQEWDFTTACVPLEGPILYFSPADNSIDQSLNVKLDWKGVSGASAYEVFLTKTLPFFPKDKVGETLISMYMLSSLDPLTKYYWQIRATNGCTFPPLEGPTCSFTTAACSPLVGPIIYNTPANHASNQPLIVHLNWEDVTRANYYDVFLTDTLPFKPEDKVGMTESSQYTLYFLPQSTKFYWQITAHNDCTWPPLAGETWDFTTGQAVTESDKLYLPLIMR